jgi:hypothetical protein
MAANIYLLVCNDQSKRYEMMFHCGFGLLSLMNHDIEHVFIDVLEIYMSSLEECLC